MFMCSGAGLECTAIEHRAEREACAVGDPVRLVHEQDGLAEAAGVVELAQARRRIDRVVAPFDAGHFLWIAGRRADGDVTPAGTS